MEDTMRGTRWNIRSILLVLSLVVLVWPGCNGENNAPPAEVDRIEVGYKLFEFPYTERLNDLFTRWNGTCTDLTPPASMQIDNWCEGSPVDLDAAIVFVPDATEGFVAPVRSGSPVTWAGESNFVYWFVDLWNAKADFRDACLGAGMEVANEPVSDPAALDIEKLNWTTNVYNAFATTAAFLGKSFGTASIDAKVAYRPHGIFIVDMPDPAVSTTTPGRRIPSVRVALINYRQIENWVSSLYSLQLDVAACDQPDILVGLSHTVTHELFHYLCGPNHHSDHGGGDYTSCAAWTGAQLQTIAQDCRAVSYVCNECWNWVGRYVSCSELLTDE